MKLTSAKYRILLGTLGWIVLLGMGILNVLKGLSVDATIVTTIGSTSTLLLGIGIIKQHRAFQNGN